MSVNNEELTKQTWVHLAHFHLKWHINFVITCFSFVFVLLLVSFFFSRFFLFLAFPALRFLRCFLFWRRFCIFVVVLKGLNETISQNVSVAFIGYIPQLVQSFQSASSPSANAFREKCGKTAAQGLMGTTRNGTVPQHKAHHVRLKIDYWRRCRRHHSC